MRSRRADQVQGQSAGRPTGAQLRPDLENGGELVIEHDMVDLRRQEVWIHVDYQSFAVSDLPTSWKRVAEILEPDRLREPVRERRAGSDQEPHQTEVSDTASRACVEAHLGVVRARADHIRDDRELVTPSDLSMRVHDIRGVDPSASNGVGHTDVTSHDQVADGSSASRNPQARHGVNLTGIPFSSR